MKQIKSQIALFALCAGVFSSGEVMAAVTVNVDGQTYQCTPNGGGGGGTGVQIVTCVCRKDGGSWGNENVIMNRLVKDGTTVLDSRVLKRFPFISGNVPDLNKQLHTCESEAVLQPLCFK